MYLVDKDIKKAIKEGAVVIKDFDEARLNPASYDILLGNKFFATDPHTTPFIDPVNKIFTPMHEINIKDGDYFVLHPGFSILGYSHDFFGSDKYLIQLNGKSSLARIGLLVHASAPIINPGHFLNVALELFNLNTVPILLRPKMRVGQLTFSTLSDDTNKSYKETGRYVKNNIAGWLPERDHFVPPKTRKKIKGEIKGV
ncbi:MAG: dCTP deaminase [Candidatus Vogelbacteria bacterium CG10_big_fil_rev_8_21_14_0_10_45_14]|uniref:dCTP deaminase n=1 Tax=Candidatus Vogelbacteria bacterium CG10_big_fil_rev_8_21_14_0_10_45_14 TaxID=1975042 RepID=A0A2H0RL15_9BACT|nr:MAG: dCTP deaminase [Candidatus Vogelbacteria bacterium CG10_big_fil_rev_8_21_14_0_10_45_14]